MPRRAELPLDHPRSLVSRHVRAPPSTRRLDAEVREHRRRDLGDARGLGVDADVSSGHERVAGDERAVAAAARVVAAAEVGELPALRRRDEQLAGVRVRERRRATRVQASVAAAPAVVAPEAQLLAVAPRDGLVALAAKRDVDRRLAVEPPRELGRVDARARQEVDLARRGSRR